jgi:outer membrane lipoprotein LolB
MPILPFRLFACRRAGRLRHHGTAPVQSAPPSAAYRDTIDLNGRLSVNYQKDGKPGNVNGNSVDPASGPIDVSLNSPLGRRWPPSGHAAVRHADPGRPRAAHGRDIDALTRRRWAGRCRWPACATGCRAMPPMPTASASPLRPPTTACSRRMAGACASSNGRRGGQPRPMPRASSAERSATATSDELAIQIVVDPGAEMALTSLHDCPAPAKLNLFLHVVGRRADGYHLLQRCSS